MNDRETNDRFRKEDRRDMVPAAVLSGCVHVILFVGLFSVFQWTTDSETVYAELWAPEPVSARASPPEGYRYNCSCPGEYSPATSPEVAPTCFRILYRAGVLALSCAVML